MSEWLEIVVLTWCAGLMMGAGGLLAAIERVQSAWLEKELRHGIIAFGGGTLVSAVCLVLVPEGIKNLSLVPASLSFMAGGVFFMIASWYLAKSKTSAANLMAMLADYIPEAMALGALLGVDEKSGYLIALLIGLQNFPEGFNAFREMQRGKLPGGIRLKSKSIILFLFVLSAIGPLTGLTGYFFLAEHPAWLSAIMLFSSGGILYLVFEDIAPQAKLKNAWVPPFGAILGFQLGLAGHILLN